MARPADHGGSHTHVPAAESPAPRSGEQEVAAGRTAGTPVATIGTVVAVVAAAFIVVAALVVLGYLLA
jgi:hypothetical protein